MASATALQNPDAAGEVHVGWLDVLGADSGALFDCPFDRRSEALSGLDVVPQPACADRSLDDELVLLLCIDVIQPRSLRAEGALADEPLSAQPQAQFAEAMRSRFYRRMCRTLAGQGLVLGEVQGLCCVMGTSRQLTARHRRWLVGWLCDQPEVAMVLLGDIRPLQDVVDESATAVRDLLAAMPKMARPRQQALAHPVKSPVDDVVPVPDGLPGGADADTSLRLALNDVIAQRIAATLRLPSRSAGRWDPPKAPARPYLSVAWHAAMVNLLARLVAPSDAAAALTVGAAPGRASDAVRLRRRE